jgi:hypothetical protein
VYHVTILSEVTAIADIALTGEGFLFINCIRAAKFLGWGVCIMGIRAFGVRAAASACIVAASVMASGRADAATTLVDNYWGGRDYLHYGDSIGGGVFNVDSAVISRVGVNGTTLKVVINTAYAGKAGTQGTGYGALFITPGANAWTPIGSDPHHVNDVYQAGDWKYAFTMPRQPGGDSGAGRLYSVLESRVIMSNSNGNTHSYPQPGHNGHIFREGQAVRYNGRGQSAVASGSWSVSDPLNTITFLINDNNMLGNSFAMSWAMDCANDVIQGQISAAVPEPSTWAMMLIGFAGLGYTARRRRIAGPRSVAA